jgi:hypothetical protein
MTQFDSASLGGSNQRFGDHQNDVRYSAVVVFQLWGEVTRDARLRGHENRSYI